MSRNDSAALPQGFSVFQPVLGAQLQWFPVIGSAELDAMVNEHLPGPASLQEKRATIALDFFEYSQLTGQSFKFYPVHSMATPPGIDSAATASPYHDSGYGSSFNVSPVMSNWDWSQVSTSSNSPQQRRHQSHKASSSRQPADFSSIPGMKIMTRDGLDVTNSASRGSKTKEQRDHAHLMRIIKACDSCRRKKIRCDPSHKKRTAGPTPQATSKVSKKAKPAARQPRVMNPVVVQDELELPDATLVMEDIAEVSIPDAAAPVAETWDQLIHYPGDMDADYDFFYDPNGYLSPQSSSSLSSDSAKASTPTSQDGQGVMYQLPGTDAHVPSLQLPFDLPDSSADYVDFNLFSPSSSFSEDERMVPIELPRSRSSQSPLESSDTQPSRQSPESVDYGAYRDPGKPQDSLQDGAQLEWRETHAPSLQQQQTTVHRATLASAPSGLSVQDWTWSQVNVSQDQRMEPTLTVGQPLRDFAETRYGNGIASQSHADGADSERSDQHSVLDRVNSPHSRHSVSDQLDGGNVVTAQDVACVSRSILDQNSQSATVAITESINLAAHPTDWALHSTRANAVAASVHSSHQSPLGQINDDHARVAGDNESRRNVTVAATQEAPLGPNGDACMTVTTAVANTRATLAAPTGTTLEATGFVGMNLLSDAHSSATEELDHSSSHATSSDELRDPRGMPNGMPTIPESHAPGAYASENISRDRDALVTKKRSNALYERLWSMGCTSTPGETQSLLLTRAAAFALPLAMFARTFGPVAYDSIGSTASQVTHYSPVMMMLALLLVLLAVSMGPGSPSSRAQVLREEKLHSAIRSPLGFGRKRLSHSTSPVSFPMSSFGHLLSI